MSKGTSSETTRARTDLVLVHERDEVRLGEQRRLRRLALAQRELVGLEALADLELGEVVSVPLVKDVDLEVVALADDEACEESSPGVSRAPVFPEDDDERGAPLAEKTSPAMSISTVVSSPRAFLEQHPRKRRTMSSYTDFSSPLRLLTCAVGWIGGCALSFFLPLRGRSKPLLLSRLVKRDV